MLLLFHLRLTTCYLRLCYCYPIFASKTIFMKKALIFLILSSSILTLSAQTKTKSAKTPAADTAKQIPYLGPKGCPGTMSAEEFSAVKKDISNETDIDNIIVIAKKEAAGHCFSTQQVKTILKLLRTDENRFDFFKAVYPHIYDQNNYPSLKDTFQDASYSDKMRIYVNSLE